MNGNSEILIYKVNNELKEIKRLVQDFRIKQKLENMKINMDEISKILKAKENYFKEKFKEKENADRESGKGI